MRPLICLILVALPFASPVAAQARADTLAIFDAAAKKIGMSRDLKPWYVAESDSLTARFAAHRRQPTKPIPQATLYCTGSGGRPGEIEGRVVSVSLTFAAPGKAYFSVTRQCTMRRDEIWGFVSGDTVALELRDGVWVATSHSVMIS